MATDSFPHAASAEHLTAALHEAGVLDAGCVSDVTVISARDTIVSHIIRLGLSYDGPAANAPQSLILKIAHANFASTLWRAGRQEVAFYETIAPAMPANLTPRCFGSDWNDEAKTWHLLLEDLTDSHHIVTDGRCHRRPINRRPSFGRWRARMPRGGTILISATPWAPGSMLTPCRASWRSSPIIWRGFPTCAAIGCPPRDATCIAD